jgi:hypothetical protein
MVAVVSAADSDVTFVSSDGVLFCIHKINLTVSAGGFAPQVFETQGENIHFAETAQTLELLFQFCYPDYYPDIEVLEFSEFAMLAETAEKYQVFSAMNVCKIRMKLITFYTRMFNVHLLTCRPTFQKAVAEPCG